MLFSRLTSRLTALVLLFTIHTYAAQAQTERIRLAAANISSGAYQSYQGEGTRILQGIDADVISIQEFTIYVDSSNTASDGETDTGDWVESTFGEGWYWYREPGGHSIPNGIVSRYEILESGEIDDTVVSDRDFAYARIDLPGDIDLWVVSAHLYSSGSATDRNSQASEITAGLATLGASSDDYIMIAGDFNTRSTSEACISTFSSYLNSTSPSQTDQNGDNCTNANRNEPYDWVLVDGDLAALETNVDLTSASGSYDYDEGLIVDTRVFSSKGTISDISPAEAGDSGVTNMQHMAVVRDFLIPTGEADFTVSGDAIAFGQLDAGAGLHEDSSINVTVTNAFTLSSVTWSGAYAGEFELAVPSLPASISADTTLTFRWTPASNDGASRAVTAEFSTNALPATFEIALTGRTNSASGGVTGDPLDIGDYEVVQAGGDATFTFPASTGIEPGQIAVIGRDADQSAFESFWGVTLGSDVLYFNGMDVAGNNGFPVINGSETYTLLDDSSSTIEGPTPAMSSGYGYERASTSDAATASGTWTEVSAVSSTPGTWTGTLAGTGSLCLTEYSDASGSGNYIYEFVELVYDAAATPVEISAFEIE